MTDWNKIPWDSEKGTTASADSSVPQYNRISSKWDNIPWESQKNASSPTAEDYGKLGIATAGEFALNVQRQFLNPAAYIGIPGAQERLDELKQTEQQGEELLNPQVRQQASMTGPNGELNLNPISAAKGLITGAPGVAGYALAGVEGIGARAALGTLAAVGAEQSATEVYQDTREKALAAHMSPQDAESLARKVSGVGAVTGAVTSVGGGLMAHRLSADIEGRVSKAVVGALGFTPAAYAQGFVDQAVQDKAMGKPVDLEEAHKAGVVAGVGSLVTGAVLGLAHKPLSREELLRQKYGPPQGTPPTEEPVQPPNSPVTAEQQRAKEEAEANASYQEMQEKARAARLAKASKGLEVGETGEIPGAENITLDTEAENRKERDALLDEQARIDSERELKEMEEKARLTRFEKNRTTEQAEDITPPEPIGADEERSELTPEEEKHQALLEQLSGVEFQHDNKPKEKSLPAGEIEYAANKYLAKDRHKFKVRAFSDFWNDPAIPQRAKDTAREQGLSDPPAFADGDTIYLNSNHIDSYGEIVRQVEHEKTHLGQKVMLSAPDLLKRYHQVANAMPHKVAEIQEQLKRQGAKPYDLNDPDHKKAIGSEIVAQIGEKNPKNTLVKKAIYSVREGLRKLGVDFKYSDNDIFQKFIVPAKEWLRTGKANGFDFSNLKYGQVKHFMDMGNLSGDIYKQPPTDFTKAAQEEVLRRTRMANLGEMDPEFQESNKTLFKQLKDVYGQLNDPHLTTEQQTDLDKQRAKIEKQIYDNHITAMKKMVKEGKPLSKYKPDFQHNLGDYSKMDDEKLKRIYPDLIRRGQTEAIKKVDKEFEKRGINPNEQPKYPDTLHSEATISELNHDAFLREVQDAKANPNPLQEAPEADKLPGYEFLDDKDLTRAYHDTNDQIHDALGRDDHESARDLIASKKEIEDEFSKRGKSVPGHLDRLMQSVAGQKVAESDRPAANSTEFQHQNPNLENFLKDSKVKDEKGKDIPLYHGTSKDKDFNKFNAGQRGIWLTENPDHASSYAKDNDSKGLKYNHETGKYEEKNSASRVMKLWASIKKPYVMTEADYDFMKEWDKKNNYAEGQRRLFNRIKQEGHDGIKFDNGKGDNTWVAFKPEQVKSATGNKGSYDPTSSRTDFQHQSPIDKIKQSEASKKFKEIGDFWQKLFTPFNRGIPAGQSARTLQTLLGQSAHEMRVNEKKLKDTLKAAKISFTKWDDKDRIEFMDNMLNGKAQRTQELQRLSNEIAKPLFEAQKRIMDQGVPAKNNFITEFLPGMFEKPADAREFFDRRIREEALHGNVDYIPSTKEAFDAGLKPISTNPIDMTLYRIQEMNRALVGRDFTKDMRDRGYAKRFTPNQLEPLGWVKLDSQFASMLPKEEGEEPGNWFVPQEVQQIVHNYLTPGLRNKIPGFNEYMKFAGALNNAQLGVSAFHAMFTTFDVMNGSIALATQELTNGNIGQAAKNIANMIPTALSSYSSRGKGAKLLEAYSDPNAHPELQPIIKDFIRAGGRDKEVRWYDDKMWNKFTEALQRGEYGSAALKAGPAVLNAIASPIMEHLVPRQKILMFSLMRERSLRLATKLGESQDQITARLQRDLASVDNRLGQLVYDNLHWNRTAKDIAQALTRSVSWNVGTFKELGGGAADLAGNLKSLASGKKTELTPAGSYVLSTVVMTMLVGSMIQKIMTGTSPQEMKDYVYPKVGGKDMNGYDLRVSVPLYSKDVMSYAHDMKRGNIETLSNKLNPAVTMVHDMFSNKDFYGQEIRHPGDSLIAQGLDEAKYVGKQFLPFGVRNILFPEQSKTPGVTQYSQLAGFPKAPQWVEGTEAYDISSQALRESLPQAARTKDAMERYQLANKIQAGLTNPDPQIKAQARQELQDSVKQGKLLDSDVKRINEKMSVNNPLLYNVTKIHDINDVMKVWRAANPEERKQIRYAVIQKIDNSKTIESEDVRRKYFKEVQGG